MYVGLHVKYPPFSPDIKKNWIFSSYFRKIYKYQISWKSVWWELSCYMRSDGRTDRTKLIVAFRNFANAPKNAFDFVCVCVCVRVRARSEWPFENKRAACRFCVIHFYLLLLQAFRQRYRTGWSSLPQSAGMSVDMFSACFHRLLTRSTVHFWRAFPLTSVVWTNKTYVTERDEMATNTASFEWQKREEPLKWQATRHIETYLPSKNYVTHM
jgi:hypothetical protein